jgi:hypothetical protein
MRVGDLRGFPGLEHYAAVIICKVSPKGSSAHGPSVPTRALAIERTPGRVFPGHALTNALQNPMGGSAVSAHGVSGIFVGKKFRQDSLPDFAVQHETADNGNCHHRVIRYNPGSRGQFPLLDSIFNDSWPCEKRLSKAITN